MSADYETHIILHHLDDPLRILKWTVDEALIIIVPPFIGLGADQPLLGFVMAAAGFWSIKRFKERIGMGFFKQWIYWYLPHNYKKLKTFPPSYIREYVG